MTPACFAKLKAVLNRRQPDLSVLLDNVHKPRNLSAILRTCDAVGVLRVHAVWPDQRYGPHRRNAAEATPNFSPPIYCCAGPARVYGGR